MYPRGDGKKKCFSFSPHLWVTKKRSGLAKIFVFKFGYLIRVEHEKFPEMCAWIVRFGQKLRNWD
jgi:hypothetical protein